MPELPEIETIKRVIEPQLVNKKIVRTSVLNPQIIGYPDPASFIDLLTSKTITHISRRGKYLNIHLVNGDYVVIHLRMTGQLLVMPKDSPVEKHTHLILDISDGSQVRYIDVRRFGRFWYIKSDEKDIYSGQDKLGLEPLDNNLTATYLKSKLSTRKKSIKEMLHDQSIVAGIGNIYSDEILYDSKVYPAKKCIDLDENEWQQLAKSIPKIIAWGITTNDTTPEEYLAGKGKEYRNMPDLKAYGQDGNPCLRCGIIMKKITIGGRSSTFCPQCQENDDFRSR